MLFCLFVLILLLAVLLFAFFFVVINLLTCKRSYTYTTVGRRLSDGQNGTEEEESYKVSIEGLWDLSLGLDCLWLYSKSLHKSPKPTENPKSCTIPHRIHPKAPESPKTTKNHQKPPKTTFLGPQKPLIKDWLTLRTRFRSGTFIYSIRESCRKKGPQKGPKTAPKTTQKPPFSGLFGSFGVSRSPLFNWYSTDTHINWRTNEHEVLYSIASFAIASVMTYCCIACGLDERLNCLFVYCYQSLHL